MASFFRAAELFTEAAASKTLRAPLASVNNSGIAISRWLSEATPPEPNPGDSRTPAGVPAPTLLARRSLAPQPPINVSLHHFQKTPQKPAKYHFLPTLTQPRTHRKQATRHARASLRWWTKSRCDFVCLRSRHFVAWLRRGLAHDAIAIQVTKPSQSPPPRCFPEHLITEH